MKETKYQPIIGLEVHVELKTRSKMFCSCSADYFGKEPDTHTCPVCLGLPGALPVPNKTAIEWCIKIGLALHCDVQLFSKFDRKNYFYPDLAKGYQISQYDQPFCLNGSIELSNGKKISIRRVHMEEDTGKLLHEAGSSLIDFNRSGVPLVEIVTGPDFETPEEVVEYLKKLQQIVRYLDVSNADMEKGDMRLEPNISLRKPEEEGLPSYKVEVKNINSFSFVAKAINFELKRQAELLDKNETPPQETRGWDSVRNKTVSQRVKEEANDYRYFPEPDIPPLRFTESQISNIKSQMPELPDAKRARFVKEYSLTTYDTDILTRDISTADYFEECFKALEKLDAKRYFLNAKSVANYIINKKVDIEKILPAELIQQIIASSKVARVDEERLKQTIEQVFSENEKAVQDYKAGKTTVLMFLVGQTMRKFPEKIDAKIVTETLKNMLQ